jgi:RNA-binding protein
MKPLTGAQRRYLRSQAHHLDPAVLIGKNGLTDAVIAAVDESLEVHELIKVRFVEHKDERKTLAPVIAQRTQSHLAGLVGHIAILYRQHEDEDKRRIHFKK